jgi:hypothetical protein
MVTEKSVKKTKTPPNHYPVEVWATIRALYESGQFHSLKELHQHCTKLFKPCPTLQSMKVRCSNDGWDKAGQKEAIEEQKAKNFKEYFAELGLDDRRTAQVIVDGVLCAEKMRDKIIEVFKQSGPEIFSDPDSMINMSSLISSLFQNMNTAHRYLETKLKLSGDSPTEKKRVVLKDESGPVMVRKLDDMTDEELDTQLERIRKSRNLVVNKIGDEP